ncbi:MAG: acetyl-CoA carboxylase biotin carboxylase subunit [Bacteroidota bacterium]|nr:acetyl-CoA carboxylase biotin carboxylase subunit [Bacteroidota bacterium]MDP4232359.1 acetyl-CoA carboxylase biotin carboxylase subunit [Bacteroidota bacterium]MDP4241496.1 acetyl-CoA carboxylase biotin carboxylase subunit [Bacteroidota bacterium]MDP4289006.1 acetyl-CoA carboxylase biotin carboxylase subunit [Bacteroidota bacterium]
MFSKILIANRGEIALRIIRTCREMGVKTVAVYSEADKHSLHVKFADEAVCIGPPPGRESYLNIPRIISAAHLTGAEAIHPGYGFLAENAEFSDICAASGFTFIGPKPEMIEAMGDKARAKDTMKAAGVPVVQGSDGVIKDVDEARQVAEMIGFPVIIKAVAGGGGRGMRIVHNIDELAQNVVMAQTEAAAAFNNGDVYIEKYIDRPRHIEIQVFGDTHGTVVHYNERECSIQRRHQKLLEESPSPVVSEATRTAMGAASIKGASSVGYVGAGTIEFLLDKDNNFYFMEMNTRIQVEHPVTEQVIGLDLIRQQLHVAAGGRLSKRPRKPEGHAIECRINAEDPEKDFRPSPGQITSFHAPGGYGVRLDSHVYSGYHIPPYYDSLIGKLITFGADRAEAIERMASCLDEMVVEGIKTTIPFHRALMRDERFRAGEFDTHFLESFNWKQPT